MTSNDSSLGTKPTSDVANSSASPFSGTGGSFLDGKNKSSGSSSSSSGPGMFDKDGAIGGAFTAEGALGSTAQSIGGPFDKEGAIGKQFTTEGSIGGAAQQNLGGGSK